MALLSPKPQSSAITLKAPDPDFVPYACHYDAHTVLTKNGELLQVFKMTGFAGEVIGRKTRGLREVLREAIKEHIATDDFALWITTVRRHQNLDPGGDFDDPFSAVLADRWSQTHALDRQYTNEVYITIIRDGMDFNYLKPKDFMLSFSSKLLARKHKKFLKKAHQELQDVTEEMLNSLAQFGAKRLGIYQKEGVYHSELLQFFSKILHLEDVPEPLPAQDLSETLVDAPIAFGFNSFEVHAKEGKHFGAMLTLKEYYELPSKTLDDFLQLPMRFVITQTLDFVNSSKARKRFDELYRTLQSGGSEALIKVLRLEEMLDDKGKTNAFGESQLSICIIADQLNELENNIRMANNALCSLGMVCVRRDLRMEECFWAQLPANFYYISRLRYMSTLFVGGFASLYNFPAGQRLGNHWGPAATVFRTMKGTPYFFNFHVEDNGHTSLIGPFGTGKTVLMNFLVASARKYDARLFFFDQERASKVFIKAIKGYYTIIEPTVASEEYAFNPLLIPDGEENRQFLYKWLGYLLKSAGHEVSQDDMRALVGALGKTMPQPNEKRRLSTLVSYLPPALQERFSLWIKGGKYGHLFDNDKKHVLDLTQQVYGFGMSRLVKDKVALVPVLSYLFHHIEMELDGQTPTMIVLDEAWNLVNNAAFAPYLEHWLITLREKNAMVIFASESVKDVSKTEITRAITKQIATKIFLPNVDAFSCSNAYRNVWGLSDSEFKQLESMEPHKRQFMLKQRGNAVVIELDLSGFPELPVLSGGDKTVTIMESVIEKVGDDPTHWLPVFYELVKKS